MSFFADLLQSLLPGTSGIERLAAVFTAALAALTDVRMWRSLGWLLIGVVLLLLGGYWLVRTPAARAGEWVQAA